jgi:UDP-N-acetylglucosamine 2-epimerase (non-hydrolysing)/GDP/UDP-N,N'-diacetylbacillosamine 2-epimerase (hydrolysing)
LPISVLQDVFNKRTGEYNASTLSAHGCQYSRKSGSEIDKYTKQCEFMNKSKRKICVVTGTRAEYGLLYWLMREINSDQAMSLQIIATGTHLSPEFGLTYKVIEQDGFTIDAKVEMLLSSDTGVGVAKSIGLGVIGFADALDRLKPDLLVLLGDRYEILAAAQAAMAMRVPIAHIAGGDSTEGAIDDAIRHCLTKIAHLHFVTNKLSCQRVIQLGEDPGRVFCVGSTGIDYIKRARLLTRDELAGELNFRFREKNILITFHPVTLESGSAGKQCEQLLAALDLLGNYAGLIFTMPNSDMESRVISELIQEYCHNHHNAKYFISLGQPRYLSLLAQVDAVVGNSSSGIYEAPSFGKPTVNIGNRQKGRAQALSVINCEPTAAAIYDSIGQALQMDCGNVVNPYGDGTASAQIASILRDVADFQSLLQKRFFEVNPHGGK